MDRILNKFLEPGHFLAFHLRDGKDIVPLYYQVIGSEFTLVDSIFSSISAKAVSGWTKIRGNSDQELLSPDMDWMLYHYFWGVSPGSKNTLVYEKSAGKIKRDLRDMIDPTNATNGPLYGHIPGHLSPLDDPSPITESLMINELEPSYNIRNENTTSGDAITPTMRFYIMKYYVSLVNNREQIIKFAQKKQRVKYLTIGSLNRPAVPPNWIKGDMDRTKLVLDSMEV